MTTSKLAPNEAIEVRELISQQVLGLKKVTNTVNTVKDPELKSYIQDSITAGRTAIQQIETTLSKDIGI